jgi:hypothetical protein
MPFFLLPCVFDWFSLSPQFILSQSFATPLPSFFFSFNSRLKFGALICCRVRSSDAINVAAAAVVARRPLRRVGSIQRLPQRRDAACSSPTLTLLHLHFTFTTATGHSKDCCSEQSECTHGLMRSLQVKMALISCVLDGGRLQLSLVQRVMRAQSKSSASASASASPSVPSSSSSTSAPSSSSSSSSSSSRSCAEPHAESEAGLDALEPEPESECEPSSRASGLTRDATAQRAHSEHVQTVDTVARVLTQWQRHRSDSRHVRILEHLTDVYSPPPSPSPPLSFLPSAFPLPPPTPA